MKFKGWMLVGVVEVLAPCLAFAESMEDVICVQSCQVAVRSEDLRRVLVNVPSKTPVKVFQSWDDFSQEGFVRGRTRDFVRVEVDLPHRFVIGWVSNEYIRPAGSCGRRQSPSQAHTPPGWGFGEPPKKKGQAGSSTSVTKGPKGTGSSIGFGLNDPNCCVFPLDRRPNQSYLNGGRNFGATRSGGKRKHAACDLKFREGVPILAITDGVVTQGYYRFYKHTYALEITHTGGFVARYSEVNSHRPRGVVQGARVSKGQLIGQMGLMLHLELYTGQNRGSLTNRQQPYNRRADLIDPTPYLKRWEAKL